MIARQVFAWIAVSLASGLGSTGAAQCEQKLVDTGSHYSNRFGKSCAIDGNWMVVAPADGHVLIYRYDGTTWITHQNIDADQVDTMWEPPAIKCPPSSARNQVTGANCEMPPGPDQYSRYFALPPLHEPCLCSRNAQEPWL